MGKIEDILQQADTATILAHDISDIWIEPSKIPPREWIYDRHYIRKFISSTVAPGGGGKSTLVLAEAVAMASGKSLLGRPVRAKSKVWYWNGEDPLEEILRRVAAICKHHEVSIDDLRGQLFVSSGREQGSQIQIATDGVRGGWDLKAENVARIANLIAQTKVEVVIIDPFVRTHGVNENDNQKINAVVEQFAKLADAGNCAIELVHHVTKAKSGDNEYTVMDGRGASALHAAARSMRVLNPMIEKEALEAGLLPKQRRFYFRVDNGKSNMAPPPDHMAWYYLADVSLDNSVGDDKKPDHWRPTDHVGVVEKFVWPEDAKIPIQIVRDIQLALSSGAYRYNSQSDDWAGYIVADRMKIKLRPRLRGEGAPPETEENKTARAQVKRHIEKLLQDKYLIKIPKIDKKGKSQEFLLPGETSSDARAEHEEM